MLRSIVVLAAVLSLVSAAPAKVEKRGDDDDWESPVFKDLYSTHAPCLGSKQVWRC